VPLPGDHGAYGHFDNRAHNRSFELWPQMHAKWIGVAAGLGFGTAALGALIRLPESETGNDLKEGGVNSSWKPYANAIAML
jgi:hypothetical protein